MLNRSDLGYFSWKKNLPRSYDMKRNARLVSFIACKEIVLAQRGPIQFCIRLKYINSMSKLNRLSIFDYSIILILRFTVTFKFNSFCGGNKLVFDKLSMYSNNFYFCRIFMISGTKP